MNKNKPKVITVLLIFITILLVGTIFFISTLLTASDKSTTSQIVPRKTKASNVTYSKLIALNQSLSEESITPTLPDENYASEENKIEKDDEMLTPTPTEIVLAYTNPSITATDTAEIENETTLSPTKVKDLPDAGFVYNGLIIFAAAMVLVFFSFLF